MPTSAQTTTATTSTLPWFEPRSFPSHPKLRLLRMQVFARCNCIKTDHLELNLAPRGGQETDLRVPLERFVEMNPHAAAQNEVVARDGANGIGRSLQVHPGERGI